MKEHIDAALAAMREAIAGGEHDAAATYADIVRTLTAKSQSYLNETSIALIALGVGVLVGHFG